MNNAKHEWCSDTARDEAVRAAEDAAAVPAIQHRDLPDEVALLRASVADILGRVVRLEGEMDAGEDEEAAPAVCDPAFPGEGMRTERVTLEFHIEGPPPTQWPWSYILNRSDAFKMRPGESVRVVEETKGGRLPDMVAWITAERDAAQAERDAARSECERLWQAIGLATTAVPSLEIKADDPVGMIQSVVSRVAELEAAAAPVAESSTTPSEPRGWMTAEERACVEELLPYTFSGAQAKTLTALLARSSPPRVKVPMCGSDFHWIAAIREAGGEVEE